MNKEQATILAHELTIKYIEINKNILNDPSLSNIPEMVDKFANINKTFFDALIDNKTLDKIY